MSKDGKDGTIVFTSKEGLGLGFLVYNSVGETFTSSTIFSAQALATMFL
jgi:hypothetical protein